jgi:hypothetical protein
MFNYFMCILWPILALGAVGAFRFGRKRWGTAGSVILPVAFLFVFLLLGWMWVGETWWQTLFIPFIWF